MCFFNTACTIFDEVPSIHFSIHCDPNTVYNKSTVGSHSVSQNYDPSIITTMVVHISFTWRHSCSACVRQTSHTFCTLRFALPRSSSIHFKRKYSHNKLFLEELMFYEITVNSNTAVCLRHYLKTFNTFHVKASKLTNNVLTKERKSKFRLLNLKN